ncbi:hypothetical protein AVO41_01235 [Thiomicrospira sp. WB1]|nr:hypothetical protein AVO41_01235 [Thiomicrospira sp. WB1]
MSYDVSTAEPVIVAKDLAKSYRQFDHPADRLKQALWGQRKTYYKGFDALKPVSFELKRGQVLGVVGDNGAGKSTLLQLVCGTLLPSKGHVSVHGRVAALLELGSGFNPDFTGRENVYLNGSILGLSQAEISQRFDEIVAFSGIGDFINQPVKTYSSGMMVRLAFAVATSVEPDILIIDEALSVGDGAFARKSFDRIMALKEQGTSILFCSHNLYQVEAICTEVMWLNQGRIEAFGPPGEVIKRYEAHLFEVEAGQDTQRIDHRSPDTSDEALLPGQGVHPKFTHVQVELDQMASTLTEVPEGQTGQSVLKVHAHWRCVGDLPPPSFAVTLHALDGRMVASAGTHIDQVELPCRQGAGQVTLSFDDLALLKGEYWVEVYLLCENGVLFYDQRVPAARFRMTQPDFALEQGLVHLPRNWNSE